MAHLFRSQKKSPKAFSEVACAAALLAVLVGGAKAPPLHAGESAPTRRGGALAPPFAQERGPAATAPEQIRAAINQLANLDYEARVKAARLVRRSGAAVAVPALVQAINEHKDGFVRFRSLVLLTGFNDPRAADEMREALASPNDRLREVGYGYFELHPDRSMVPRFLEALEKDAGDFVRPAIVRALAAVGDNPKVREVLLRDVMRGVDFHRSTVIEALGDYKHTYAIRRLVETAQLDGPLQDDAVIALGRLGDKQTLPVLANLQRTGSKELQPSAASAICMLGVNCSSHLGYLDKVLAFADDNPGYQELVRPTAAGLAAIAIGGNAGALKILFDRGIPSMDPIRAPLALAVAKVALRSTPLMLAFLEKRTDQSAALDLVAEGFDMLEEDLEEEQFFVTVRKGYWAAPDNSAARKLAEQLIAKLDF
jgi:HEAT repeat protein